MPFLEPTRQNLEEKLRQLTSEHEAQWGMLTPQHMLEHLIGSLKMSRGAVQVGVQIPEEQVDKMQRFLFSDQPMPQGVKSANMPEGLPELQFSDLETAKAEFLKEWDRFVEAYEAEPEKNEAHPVFGELGKEGWYQVHRKHFTHHFQQFGLLEVEA